jgi:hypothetical protein
MPMLEQFLEELRPESDPTLRGSQPMTVSMLDLMFFYLPCRHKVVLGRLEEKAEWTCEECGEKFDLTTGPIKDALAQDLDTAKQIDLQEQAKGNTISRLG